MHSGEAGEISIWFFIGVLLTIYGALILAYGVWEWFTGNLANVILKELHAPVWWGAVLLMLGLFYASRFRPDRAH